jgi:hypothetical protein
LTDLPEDAGPPPAGELRHDGGLPVAGLSLPAEGLPPVGQRFAAKPAPPPPSGPDTFPLEKAGPAVSPLHTVGAARERERPFGRMSGLVLVEYEHGAPIVGERTQVVIEDWTEIRGR